MYKAIVYGAGSIGALKPDEFDSPTSENILTHAHAYFANPNIELVGIVDKNKKKAEQAAQKWGTKAFVRSDSFSLPHADIASICVPDEYHWDVIYDAVWFQDARVIICEKPCGTSETDAKNIVGLLKRSKAKLLVNYTRRYEYSLNILQKDIVEGKLGKVFWCVIKYDRGITRDGSHAIDLCHYLFGNCNKVKVLPGFKVSDYSPQDPSIPVFLSYTRCKSVFLIPSDGRCFSIFEVDILTEKGRFTYRDHGTILEYYPVEKEKTYGTYNALSVSPRITQTNLTKCLPVLINNAIALLEDPSAKGICTGKDAIEVHKTLRLIRIHSKV